LTDSVGRVEAVDDILVSLINENKALIRLVSWGASCSFPEACGWQLVPERFHACP
jgi:hypothetical protein